MSISRASSTLVTLANEVQAALEEFGKKGMKLSEGIKVFGSKTLGA
jgi:hypothetical protein